MKSAIITGVTHGIGYEIANLILSKGYKVYGIGRNFEKTFINEENLIKVPLDLCNIKNVESWAKTIIKADKSVEMLINNAGVGYFGPHEQLSVKNIEEMVSVNLTAPLVLSNIFLRILKQNKGMIVNVSSITAKKSSPHGCAYASTKSAISNFSLNLFDETRKTGVKTICVYLDMTKSNFFDKSDFTFSEDYGSSLECDEVKNVFNFILNQKDGSLIQEITLRPQFNIIKRKEKS